MSVYIGLDNGISGALAILGDNPRVMKLPTLRGKNREQIDPLVLHHELISLQLTHGSIRVIAEKSQSFTPGKLALISCWDSWATIRTVLDLARIPYAAVDPRTWQRDMFKNLKPRPLDTKTASIMVARQLFPSLSLRRSNRCTTDDHNFSDALLLAEWGRRNNL